jgi:hypothetical protein
VLRQFLVRLQSRPKALVGLVFVALANQLSVVALAAAPPATLTLTGNVQTHKPSASFCTHTDLAEGCQPNGNGDTSFQLTVPDGSQPCPGSGVGAACGNSSGTATTGVASTPDGQTPCAPDNPASCSNAVLPPADKGTSSNGTPSAPVVLPSVPVTTLQDPGPVERLELVTNASSAMPGRNVQLTATASSGVTGSNTAIEIFDRTTGTLAGYCAQGSQCSVNYSSKAGVHAFTAYVTTLTSKLPEAKSAVTSNSVSVMWIGVALAAKNAIVAPGQPVTLTAASTIPIDKTGWLLQLYDAHTRARLTYCSTGSTCSTSLTQSQGGGRSVVAALAKSSPSFPAADGVVAQSDLISPTWLSLVIDAQMGSAAAGTPIYIRATSNADMTNTPWSIGILNDQNQLAGAPCKTGSACVAQVTFNGGTPTFSAAIGTVPTFDTTSTLGQVLQKISGPPKLTNILTRSAAIPPQVTRILWGVDSCKSFTTDPNGGNGLLPLVRRSLGNPDFWGRYLTETVCPGISGAEIEAAHRTHMAILPIYNDYNCSAVVGYGAGHQYAAAATEAALNLGIPQGRALVIDIEPPGAACPGAVNVDSGFVQGWYDGVTAAHYVAAYYGDGTGGKEFGTAWCNAVTSRPEIANNSFLWSFQPSLLGNFSKAHAPGFAPNVTGCPGHASAWQYSLSAGGDPDVDQDELNTELPLWYP